jgi:seryl-tRNA synthetase
MSNSVIDQFTRALEACQERAENAERERDELADNIGNQAAEQQEVAETLAYERDQYKRQRDTLQVALENLIGRYGAHLLANGYGQASIDERVKHAQAALDGVN